MNPLLLEGVFEIGKSIIEHLFPDPEKKAAAELELLKLKESGDLARLASLTALAQAQIGVNAEEVKSGSLLGKWRGFLGWGLACTAIYQLMVQPFFVAIALLVNPQFPVEKMPKLEWAQLGQLLMGMLGLGS